MIFVIAILAWSSLFFGGIGLIVVSEPWWNRSRQPAARPIPLASRRPVPHRAGEPPCLDCAA